MNSKRPCVERNIAFHQILDYMLSSSERGDDSDDPPSDKDVLNNLALSFSSSVAFLF